ncbi:MAG: alpha,2-mannosyltransferase [Mycobacterium sp.]|nr:alpha,2-mannosyltransferase [Mycobacterium sp.]
MDRSHLGPSRRLIVAGPLLLFVAVALYGLEFSTWHAYVTQIDAMVYRFGGQRVLNGRDLYSTGIFGSHRILLFTYTPFAALCFIPLNLLTLPWLRALSLLSAAGLLAYSIDRMLTAMSMPQRRGRWTLTALLLALCLWLEPVRYSIQLGQINLLILAVVVADLLGPARRRWAGVGIGVMAGIKLTPAIFLLLLFLIGRRRASAVGVVAFFATIAAGFATLPGDSIKYWLGGEFDDPHRVSPDPSLSSSVQGLFMRFHYPVWLAMVVSVSLVLACLAIAVRAWRQDSPLLAVSLVGMGGAAASPFSWSHHWVWVGPLVVHLGYRGYVTGSVGAVRAMWLLWALTAGWLISLHGWAPASGMVALRPGGVWNALLPSAYVLCLLVALCVSALWLRRETSRRPGVVLPGSSPAGARLIQPDKTLT